MKRDNLSIEGLRVILFLCIFLFHAWGQLFPIGWAGINTFLVITAYFFTLKLLKKPQTDICLKEMLWKRAARLYPAYLAVLITMSALYVLGRHQLPADFFSYFLFAQNFHWEFIPKTTEVPGCGHFWYLTLDFYLVLIWLLVFKFVPRRKLKFTFVALLVFSVIYRSLCAYYTDSITLSYTMPWGMMDAFVAGGLLAIMTAEESKTKLPWIALILGLIGFGLCVYATSERFDINLLDALVQYRKASGYADNPFTVQIHLVMVLLSIFVVWLCVCKRRHYGILSNGHLAKLGGVTYELYVFHLPIIWLLNSLTNNHVIIIFLGLITTIATTLVWKHFVDPKALVAFT